MIRIPGFTTILLYQSITKEVMAADKNVRLFTASDSEENKWIFKYFPENICAKRWDEGNKLFYLLNKDEEPCSFAWLRNGIEHYIGEINRMLVFQNKVNCIFDCITPKNHRDKGYYSSLINRLSISGNEFTNIIYASSSNLPSNKGILNGGFKLTHKLFRTLNIVTIKEMNNSGIEFNVRKVN